MITLVKITVMIRKENPIKKRKKIKQREIFIKNSYNNKEKHL